MALAEIDVTPNALPLDSIICGDALAVLRTLPDNFLDAIVTDPPAGISFMGKTWDSDKGGRDAWIAWLAEVMAESLRVVKPGGHALVWALPRTSHWTATALEDAGWEIRDRCSHIFGSGFPKSLDVSKQIDKQAGARRKRTQPVAVPRRNRDGTNALGGSWQDDPWETAPATDAARTWDGWGTALKPAVEDWWLVRKPLSESNVAANVLRWGTGALNIDGSRVPAPDGVPQFEKRGERPLNTYSGGAGLNGSRSLGISSTQGRWPANLLLSHAPECGERGCSLWCPIRALDAQSGVRTSGKMKANTMRSARSMYGQGNGCPTVRDTYGDTGGASRYFQTFKYQSKASRSERNRGCSELPKGKRVVMASSGRTFRDGEWHETHSEPRPSANHHPTVKPLALMSWLIRLITPPGGIVLDPFAGSGSTLVAAKAGGWRYIGIEKEPEYAAIARSRVRAS